MAEGELRMRIVRVVDAMDSTTCTARMRSGRGGSTGPAGSTSLPVEGEDQVAADVYAACGS